MDAGTAVRSFMLEKANGREFNQRKRRLSRKDLNNRDLAQIYDGRSGVCSDCHDTNSPHMICSHLFRNRSSCDATEGQGSKDGCSWRIFVIESPVNYPAAYSPGIGTSFVLKTCASVLILTPPYVNVRFAVMGYP